MSAKNPTFFNGIKELSALLALKYRLAPNDEFKLDEHLALFSELRKGILDVAISAASALATKYSISDSSTASNASPLMNLLETLLEVHSSWFRQQCEEDRHVNATRAFQICQY
jgi:hypothetical protein